MQTNSLFSYEMRSPIPLMSVFKTDTVPMRSETCLVLNGVSENINPQSVELYRLGISQVYTLFS